MCRRTLSLYLLLNIKLQQFIREFYRFRSILMYTIAERSFADYSGCVDSIVAHDWENWFVIRESLLCVTKHRQAHWNICVNGDLFALKMMFSTMHDDAALRNLEIYHKIYWPQLPQCIYAINLPQIVIHPVKPDSNQSRTPQKPTKFVVNYHTQNQRWFIIFQNTGKISFQIHPKHTLHTQHRHNTHTYDTQFNWVNSIRK